MKNTVIFRLTTVMFLFGTLTASAGQKSGTIHCDICIYGATSAGVIAAYTAKKMGKTVLLIEPGSRVGGVSSGGLGNTDIGNKRAITGIARNFYQRIGAYYGESETWKFEPHVALEVFKSYLKEAKIHPFYQYRLVSVRKKKGAIKKITVENTKRRQKIEIDAKVFIDCSYEGDLMARAGVSYMVGRESNDVYGETFNGVQLLTGHQFPDGIDPYIIPGNPASGLLWGISKCRLEATGKGDEKVQAYNFRICLTSDSANRIRIIKPANYNSAKYELLLRYIKKSQIDNISDILMMSLLPNNKTDINNMGPFSTDMIGMSDGYPNADYKTRSAIIKAHEDYSKGLLYFIGNDNRVPKHLRDQMQQWGYPKDEFTGNGNWSPQLYIRESRRMIGSYVMTQANCQGRDSVKDGIALAAYTMDSHNCQRIVVNGMVKNEGNVEVRGFDPYPIAYRSITPKESQCTNLLVPVCLSASHIAYGSIRMEPVFMVLGESAALAACQAVAHGQKVQEINLSLLQEQIKAGLGELATK